MRHHIPVCEVEFDDGGNTLWVQSPLGATVLRIKCTGKVTVHRGCENLVAHSDMMVQGDIEVCLPDKTWPETLAGLKEFGDSLKRKQKHYEENITKPKRASKSPPRHAARPHYSPTTAIAGDAGLSDG